MSRLQNETERTVATIDEAELEENNVQRWCSSRAAGDFDKIFMLPKYSPEARNNKPKRDKERW